LVEGKRTTCYQAAAALLLLLLLLAGRPRRLLVVGPLLRLQTLLPTLSFLASSFHHLLLLHKGVYGPLAPGSPFRLRQQQGQGPAPQLQQQQQVVVLGSSCGL
jgi:hypothetical protein